MKDRERVASSVYLQLKNNLNTLRDKHGPRSTSRLSANAPATKLQYPRSDPQAQRLAANRQAARETYEFESRISQPLAPHLTHARAAFELATRAAEEYRDNLLRTSQRLEVNSIEK